MLCQGKHEQDKGNHSVIRTTYQYHGNGGLTSVLILNSESSKVRKSFKVLDEVSRLSVLKLSSHWIEHILCATKS